MKTTTQKLLTLTIALLLSTAPTFARKSASRKKRCQCPIPLRLDNKTNVISESGYYKVLNSMKLLEGSTALLVEADNVHIDLCNQVIEGRGNDYNDQTIGIDLSGHKNVSVKNGTVQNFSAFGLRAETVEKILLEDFCALENGSPLIITQSTTASSGILIAGTGDFGEGGTRSKDITLRRVTTDNNYATGLNMPHCIDVTAIDCNFLRTQAANFEAFGLNVSLGVSVITLSPFPLSENYYFERCHFNDNSGDSEIPAPTSAVGLEVLGFAVFSGFDLKTFKNFKLLDCDFSNNHSLGQVPIEGIGAKIGVTENIEFIRCTATNNQCGTEIPDLGVSMGWSMISCNNASWQDCIANNQVGGGQFSAGISARGCQDALFSSTTANNNYSEVAPSYGWATEAESGDFPSLDKKRRYTWTNCTANNNRSGNQSAEQAGWQLAGIDNVLINACQGNNNGFAGIITRQTDASEEPTLMRDAIVQNSTFTRNDCTGIVDTAGATTNVYRNNLGLANGGLNFELGTAFDLENVSLQQGLNPECFDIESLSVKNADSIATERSMWEKVREEVEKCLTILADQGKINWSKPSIQQEA